jgi:hypothetical protein
MYSYKIPIPIEHIDKIVIKDKRNLYEGFLVGFIPVFTIMMAIVSGPFGADAALAAGTVYGSMSAI